MGNFYTIFSDLLIDYALIKHGNGSTDTSGDWGKGSTAESIIQATKKQPLKMGEIKVAEDGENDESYIKIYTEYDVNISQNGIDADIVRDDSGIEFKVVQVEKRDDHNKVYLRKL